MEQADNRHVSVLELLVKEIGIHQHILTRLQAVLKVGMKHVIQAGGCIGLNKLKEKCLVSESLFYTLIGLCFQI